ncbi:943e2492-95c5-4913-b627-339a3e94c0c7 [Thermothielavioides terrestris]|uniref:943e2492-95c5-4913-b627-339a3e94c0c7 n=1 Tax=Thermothielavioides terrestris TaxID=2587410 RepID=A0A3S4D381_9PEZI|nr:943e2492-95c5-4913-b627-339a3e94c0c7 [Thermothielavioides terrestris]
MAEERSGSAPPPASQSEAPLAVNLQILSPSAGVGSLRFPDLPASTTVRQLKDKIRESLPRRPPDDHQRLIHRGRLLARETDSLLDILGEETPGAVPRAPGAAGPLFATDLYDAARGADANRALGAMMNAMDRHTAAVPPANVAADLANFNFNAPIQPIQPGVTTPIFPGPSRNASRAATPDVPSVTSASRGSAVAPGMQQPQAQTQTQGPPEVYILSSPTGPRGLLIHSASEMYTTPAARPLPWVSGVYRPIAQAPPEIHRPELQMQQGEGQAHLQFTVPPAQQHEPPAPLIQQQPLPQPPNEQPPAIRRRPVAAPAQPEPARPAPQVNHPVNPGAGALAAAIWPHIWLIVRLAAFTWWFSYTNPSWERWLSLALAFIIVVAINTGIFNGMVNQAFHPVREQLEGLIPFADPDRQQQQPNQQANGGVNPPGRNAATPDPAQTAARLVAQRRMQNRNWLRDQVRRIERAGILFLASFAPGVAERHIQQLEERERAERRAAEEARAAAAAAAAAQQQAGSEPGPGPAENQEQERVPDGLAQQQPAQAA